MRVCVCLSTSYNGYFVDLFVRASNNPAITMYQKVRTTNSGCINASLLAIQVCLDGHSTI